MIILANKPKIAHKINVLQQYIYLMNINCIPYGKKILLSLWRYMTYISNIDTDAQGRPDYIPISLLDLAQHVPKGPVYPKALVKE